MSHRGDNDTIVPYDYIMTIWSQVSGCLLQTAQTWANAGVCSASCAHVFGCMYVCLFVCYNLCVCFTGNLGDWVLRRGGSLLLLEKLWDFLLL